MVNKMLAAGGSRLGPGQHLLVRRGPGAGDGQRGERGQLLQHLPPRVAPRQVALLHNSAVNHPSVSQSVFTITEKAPTIDI